MLYSAAEIAAYFIWRTNLDEEFGENITNLRLQKLLYYAQGFSLTLRGVPLFPEPLEAWAHGPVVRAIFEQYSTLGAQPLPTPGDAALNGLDAETRELLEEVYSVYGQFSAGGLRNLTHEETPWQETALGTVIDTESMRAFFARLLTHA